MLRRILAAFATAPGMLSVADLARQLDVERSALEGMLTTLVQQGRLREVRPPVPPCAASGACATCAQICPLAAASSRAFPRHSTLVKR